MATMHIEKDTDITKWMGDTLSAMREVMPTTQHPCPHCKLPVRYPLVARQSDIDLFEQMVRTAGHIMDEYGITGNLLADISARCVMESSRRDKSK